MTTSTSATTVDLTTPRAQLLLAVGDDALISGHRASHWTGVAPSLEEDLAFSTIAQDGINHADVWYQLLVAETPDVRASVDAVGLGRSPQEYRHAIVCERPPGDFARTLARHWAQSHADRLRLDALSRSADGEVAAVATKLALEGRYHLEHADHWFVRLVRAGDDARQRFVTALEAVLPEALGLFEAAAGEDEAVDAGILPVGHDVLRERWVEELTPALEAADLGGLVALLEGPIPAEAAGGRAGRHTADFTEDVWPEMTALYRQHPGASW